MALTGAVNAGSIFATIGLKSTLAKDTKVANSKLGNLTKNLKSVAIPAAAAATALLAVGTAAFKLADGAGRAADELLDLEQITGLSTTTLQEYRHVAAIAGVSFDQFTKGVATFERKLPELIDGTGRTTDMMERLGVSVFDGAGNLRDMDDITPDILVALSGMSNETERNAIAMQLFGRNAEAMLPIIALGADNMKAARDEAHDMGLVIGGESLQAANAFRVEVDTLKEQLGAMGTEIGIELIPMFQGMVETLQWMVPHVKTVIHWSRILYETLILPWIALPSAMKAFRRNFVDQINWMIGKYNEAAEMVSAFGIEIEGLDELTLDKPISELDKIRAGSNAAADAAEEDAAIIEAAYSDIKIPGFAGQSEYIKSRIQEEGITLTKEEKASGITQLDKLMELSPSAVSAVTPSTITAGTPQATATGGSIAMLNTINTSIRDGNTAIVSAINSISMGAGRTGGGIGAGEPTQASPETIFARMKQNYERTPTATLRL